MPDEIIELILEIIWEEIFDEESLEELVWKTKEELERIKQDKNLILEITWNKSICISALMELREDAQRRGLPEMSLEEINSFIKEVREDTKRNKGE